MHIPHPSMWLPAIQQKSSLFFIDSAELHVTVFHAGGTTVTQPVIVIIVFLSTRNKFDEKYAVDPSFIDG